MSFNKRVAILPYNKLSESCKLLAQTMGVKRVKREGSRWRGRGKMLINWGNTGRHPKFDECNVVVNQPLDVLRASNKLSFFRWLTDNEADYLPPWTDKIAEAMGWINEGATVMCRTLTSAHEGRGIVIATTPEELVNAPLYTKYVKKKREFRIHVFQGEVIDEQEKKKRRGVDNTDHQVRNTANGYVFCRTDVVVPDCARDVAVRCVQDLALDFGGVDVIYNEHYNRAYVLEVNTAPGIEGSTLNSYHQAFLRLYNECINSGRL